MKSLILLLLSMVVGFSCERAYNQKSKGTAERGIDTNEYKVCLRILSSDSMQRRLPGTPGGNKAANYIASQFSRYGLTPISEEQGYLQQVVIESYDGILQELELAKEIGLYYASKGSKPTFNNDNPFITAKKNCG